MLCNDRGGKLMRLTKKELMSAINQPMCFGSRLVGKKMFAQIIEELCEYKTIEEELGIDLIADMKTSNKKLKAFEIIKEKKWLVEDILDAFIEDKTKYDLLKEVLL